MSVPTVYTGCNTVVGQAGANDSIFMTYRSAEGLSSLFKEKLENVYGVVPCRIEKSDAAFATDLYNPAQAQASEIPKSDRKPKKWSAIVPFTAVKTKTGKQSKVKDTPANNGMRSGKLFTFARRIRQFFQTIDNYYDAFWLEFLIGFSGKDRM